MSLDRTTETIAHFVGHFQMALEELRLRTEYNQFQAEQAEADAFQAMEFGATDLEASHKLKDFDPEVAYKPAPTPPMKGVSGAEQTDSLAQPVVPSQPFVEATQEGWIGPSIGGMIVVPYVPIPSSVITVTYQVNTLFDVDIVGTPLDVFVSSVVHYAELVAAVALAEVISGPGSAPFDAIESIAPGYSETLANEMATFEVADIEGLTATLVREDEVEGQVVNGETVDEIPELDTFLPQAVREKWGIGLGDEEAEVEETLTTDEFPTFDDDRVDDYKLDPLLDKSETATLDPYDFEPGHRLIAGMNEATNTVTLKTSMIDAGVIVVGGDVTVLTSISQVNVVSDHDIGATFKGAGTSAYNIVEIKMFAEDHEEPEEDVASAEEEGGIVPAGELGPNVGEASTETDARLSAETDEVSGEEETGEALEAEVSASPVEEASAPPVAETSVPPVEESQATLNTESGDTFTEADTQLQSTGNGVGSHVSAIASDGHSNAGNGGPPNDKTKGKDKDKKEKDENENDRKDDDHDTPEYHGLPSTWNLEVFEGDVVQINSFTQLSFAFDADQINFGFHASATYLSTGENLSFNSANALEIGFGYDLIIVGGDMIDLTMVSQTNVLLDDDTVFLDADIEVSGGDNMLLNHVSLTQHGEDSFEDMQDNFEGALDKLEDGLEELEDSVAEDELFLGVEALRALYISGDLVKVSAVSQTNILGDQDQVAAAFQDFARDADDVLEIVTGSNALTNSTVIEDIGFDSVIMASGDIYDDALLYQAELIDTDAAPTGVDLNALANEAVAFLADDMLLPELDEGAFDSHPGGQNNDAADVLQTMTA